MDPCGQRAGATTRTVLPLLIHSSRTAGRGRGWSAGLAGARACWENRHPVLLNAVPRPASLARRTNTGGRRPGRLTSTAGFRLADPIHGRPGRGRVDQGGTAHLRASMSRRLDRAGTVTSGTNNPNTALPTVGVVVDQQARTEGDSMVRTEAVTLVRTAAASTAGQSGGSRVTTAVEVCAVGGLGRSDPVAEASIGAGPTSVRQAGQNHLGNRSKEDQRLPEVHWNQEDKWSPGCQQSLQGLMRREDVVEVRSEVGAWVSVVRKLSLPPLLTGRTRPTLRPH